MTNISIIHDLENGLKKVQCKLIYNTNINITSFSFFFSVAPLSLFYIVIQITNLAQSDIIFLSSDAAPAKGFKILKNVIVKITKRTGAATAVTFTAIDAVSKQQLFIDNAKSVSIAPSTTEGIPRPLIITRKGMYACYLDYGTVTVKLYRLVFQDLCWLSYTIKILYFFYVVAKAIASKEYYILIQVVNKLFRKIIVISDDNEPAQGFPIAAQTVAVITKTVRSIQPVIFTATDAESYAQVLLNGQKNVTVIPRSDKDRVGSFTVTSGELTFCLVLELPSEDVYIFKDLFL